MYSCVLASAMSTLHASSCSRYLAGLHDTGRHPATHDHPSACTSAHFEQTQRWRRPTAAAVMRAAVVTAAAPPARELQQQQLRRFQRAGWGHGVT